MKIIPMTERAVNYTKRQQGASLLEGVAYLGIAALVLIGAVSLVGGAFSSAKSNRSIEELIALRTAISKLFTGQAYPADMVDPLITAKAIPGTMPIDSSTTPPTIRNGFGATVTIGADSNTANDNDYNITYPDVPQDVCVSILSGTSGWRSITIGSTTITTFPVDTSAATTACSSAANSIIFKAN